MCKVLEITSQNLMCKNLTDSFVGELCCGERMILEEAEARLKSFGKMEKGDVFIWVIVIGLVIFMIASFFLFAEP